MTLVIPPRYSWHNYILVPNNRAGRLGGTIHTKFNSDEQLECVAFIATVISTIAAPITAMSYFGDNSNGAGWALLAILLLFGFIIGMWLLSRYAFKKGRNSKIAQTFKDMENRYNALSKKDREIVKPVFDKAYTCTLNNNILGLEKRRKAMSNLIASMTKASLEEVDESDLVYADLMIASHNKQNTLN